MRSLPRGAGEARINFSAKASAAGYFRIELITPRLSNNTTLMVISGAPAVTLHVDAGGALNAQWNVHVAEEGYDHMADVHVVFTPDSGPAPGFARYDVRSLFARVEHGHVTASGNAIDPALTPSFAQLAPAIVKPEKAARRIATGEQHHIWVNVRGRVSYLDPGTGIHRGVPGLTVRLYWKKNDHDPNIFHLPPHFDASPRFTDTNGDYSFVMDFYEEQPASAWGDSVRVQVGTANEAAYNGDLGYGAAFPTTVTVPIDDEIDHASIITKYDANITNYTPDDGSALRHLYRARQFATHRLGIVPEQVRYYIRPDARISHFAPPGYDENGPDLEIPRIIFTGFPGSEAVYHEYGHFLEYELEHGIPHCDAVEDGHWFTRQTSSSFAWVEGWAEYICAAAHAYWYRIEMPERTELWGLDFDTHYPVYQFLDYSQGQFAYYPGRDLTQVEGAAACFFYNLLDDIPLRAPGYQGDNEDLGYDGAVLFKMLLNRFQTDGELRNSTYLESYRDGILAAMSITPTYAITYPYHSASINAMFDAVVNRQGVQRSATPTVLSVGLNAAKRPVLLWNDNTEPADITYTSENGSVQDYDFFENNETGFVIYRRAVPDGWTWDGRDGRLDPAYMRVAVVPADVTTYTDLSPLAKGARYSYVVVAFNGGTLADPDRLSIPKAEAEITTDKNITIRRDDWDKCTLVGLPIGPGQLGRLTATTNVVNPVGYHWLADHLPPYLTLQGTNSAHLTLTNAYQIGAAVNDPAPLSLRCVVTDSAGTADTSARYYPLYTPLDGAANFVAVGTASGYVTDENPSRGGELMGFPGEMMPTVYPLAVQPERSGLTYSLRLTGLPYGSTSINDVKLYAVHHPQGTVLAGTARCGFNIYVHHVDSLNHDILIPDTEHAYTRVQVPLQAAYRSGSAQVTANLLEQDSSLVTLESGDSLLLAFTEADSSALTDSTLGSWACDYLLEVVGSYVPQEQVTYAAHDNTVGDGVSGLQESSVADVGTALYQNAPNPSATETTIRYRVAQAGPVKLELFDPMGRALRTLLDAVESPGERAVRVDLSRLPSGVYCYRLTASGETRTLRMTVAR